LLISLKWLGRYVDLEGLDPSEVAEDLTRSTAEIEAVLSFGDSLEKILVGEVVEHGKHPGADKLSLCKVDIGGPETLSIVCGAPNVARGQKVAVVRPGVRLPDGTKIKKGKIRGEVSMGMICSERELGLSDEHEGILVLDPKAPVGRPLPEVLPVRDTLLEIDNKSITHRPDLWGHYGFARELAAILRRPLRPFDEGLVFPIPGEGLGLRIEVRSRACPKYLGLVLEGVRRTRAPFWMRCLLLAVGQRPIDNLVDLTNFLLLDLGQPMHAFDFDLLEASREEGRPIVVREAVEGERLETLDGQERTLLEGDLLICDGEKPIALAGVMGGRESMVAEGTRRLFLESANFHPTRIRRTAARLGLRTESAARFEKSLDPSWTFQAVRKFAGLLRETCPDCRAAGPISEAGEWRPEKTFVPLRLPRAERLLGVELTGGEVRGYLEPLGFALSEESKGTYRVEVPSWRATKDVSIEEDLVEEIGRRRLYDRIPERAPRRDAVVPYRDPELWTLRRIREVLAYDCGYFEAYNYSFLDDSLVERLGLSDLPWLRVTNSIAAHLSRMRRDVLPGLLASMADNLAREDRVALFEVGKGYRPEEPGEEREACGEAAGRLPGEVHQVAGVLADRGRSEEECLRSLRGHLAHCCRRLERRFLPPEIQEDPDPWMHPKRTSLWRVEGNEGPVDVASFGPVHPGILDALGCGMSGGLGGVVAFTLDLRAFLACPESPAPYRSVPRFPSQPVDFAFLVEESRRVAEIEAFLREADPRLVREVRVFEVYRGEGIPEGRKSCNFTVVLGSDTRTLDRKDEERFIEKVRRLASERGLELRG